MYLDNISDLNKSIQESSCHTYEELGHENASKRNRMQMSSYSLTKCIFWDSIRRPQSLLHAFQVLKIIGAYVFWRDPQLQPKMHFSRRFGRLRWRELERSCNEASQSILKGNCSYMLSKRLEKWFFGCNWGSRQNAYAPITFRTSNTYDKLWGRLMESQNMRLIRL